MAKLTPKQAADKWGRRLSGATEDIREGVGRVTESPTEKAADKKDKFIARMTSTEVQDRWERQLRKVTLADWKKSMIDKGLSRISAGVSGASGKMEGFMSELLPAVDKAAEEVKRLPDLTLEDSINRMTTFIRKMSEFKFK